MSEKDQVYQLDDAGVWTGYKSPARPDPRVEGRYLIPRGCVDVAPPDLAEHQAAQFSDGTWSVVADWRGYVYWTSDRVQHEITEIGVVPPADALDADPGPSFDDNKARAITKTLDQLRAAEGTTDRALREIVGSGHPSYARMQSIEAAVAPLRARLAAINAATDQAQLDAATQTDQPA